MTLQLELRSLFLIMMFALSQALPSVGPYQIKNTTSPSSSWITSSLYFILPALPAPQYFGEKGVVIPLTEPPHSVLGLRFTLPEALKRNIAIHEEMNIAQITDIVNYLVGNNLRVFWPHLIIATAVITAFTALWICMCCCFTQEQDEGISGLCTGVKLAAFVSAVTLCIVLIVGYSYWGYQNLKVVRKMAQYIQEEYAMHDELSYGNKGNNKIETSLGIEGSNFIALKFRDEFRALTNLEPYKSITEAPNSSNLKSLLNTLADNLETYNNILELTRIKSCSSSTDLLKSLHFTEIAKSKSLNKLFNKNVDSYQIRASSIYKVSEEILSLTNNRAESIKKFEVLQLGLNNTKKLLSRYIDNSIGIGGFTYTHKLYFGVSLIISLLLFSFCMSVCLYGGYSWIMLRVKRYAYLNKVFCILIAFKLCALIFVWVVSGLLFVYLGVVTGKCELDYKAIQDQGYARIMISNDTYRLLEGCIFEPSEHVKKNALIYMGLTDLPDYLDSKRILEDGIANIFNMGDLERIVNATENEKNPELKFNSYSADNFESYANFSKVDFLGVTHDSSKDIPNGTFNTCIAKINSDIRTGYTYDDITLAIDQCPATSKERVLLSGGEIVSGINAGNRMCLPISTYVQNQAYQNLSLRYQSLSSFTKEMKSKIEADYTLLYNCIESYKNGIGFVKGNFTRTRETSALISTAIKAHATSIREIIKQFKVTSEMLSEVENPFGCGSFPQRLNYTHNLLCGNDGLAFNFGNSMVQLAWILLPLNCLLVWLMCIQVMLQDKEKLNLPEHLRKRNEVIIEINELML